MTRYEQLLALIDTPTEDCIVWPWAKAKGYGRIRHEGRVHQATRLAYQAAIGMIPANYDLDHLCRNPSCVNPVHLEPVPHRINILRSDAPTAVNAFKTHCNAGHPFDETNTYFEGTWRHCRTCRRQRFKKWKQRQTNPDFLLASKLEAARALVADFEQPVPAPTPVDEDDAA